jgi:predicted transposase YdaD
MMALSQAYLKWEQQTEQRGRQEGRQEGELLLVLRLLNRRLGSISAEAEAQVRMLSLACLEELGKALLDFSASDDLVRWLRVH